MGRIGAFPPNCWEATATSVDLTRQRVAPLNVTVPAEPQQLTIDLGRTACIVVDMQNDFCSPDGWLASIGVDVEPARSPIGPLNALLPRLRSSDVPVIWLNWGNRADRANLPPGVLHVYDPDGASIGIGDPHPVTGDRVLEHASRSAAILDELITAPNDLFVDKYRMSGFQDTVLDGVLRNLDVSTLLFAGVNLDQCVYATLIEAAARGYDVVLLEDCSATTSPSYCRDATIYNVRQCFGFVISASDLEASLPGPS